MDELKLNLTSKLMRGIITKLIRKKLGCDIDIQINDMNVSTVDGNIHLHVDANADIAHTEFIKLIKHIGLD